MQRILQRPRGACHQTSSPACRGREGFANDERAAAQRGSWEPPSQGRQWRSQANGPPAHEASDMFPPLGGSGQDRWDAPSHNGVFPGTRLQDSGLWCGLQSRQPLVAYVTMIGAGGGHSSCGSRGTPCAVPVAHTLPNAEGSAGLLHFETASSGTHVHLCFISCRPAMTTSSHWVMCIIGTPNNLAY